jgi:carboxylesterase
MPVMPGAEAYTHDGGPTGVLLCHGFTGSPQSLRPWAEYLADAGLSVSLPRLPGHGTTWQEMARTRWEDWFAEVNRAFDELQSRSDEIFVMGLSMGGCLALRLAELHEKAIRGLVLVNPSITADSALLFASVRVLKFFVPSVKGIASDIKKPGSVEAGYDRTPLKAAASLPGLWQTTQQHLAELTQPVLVFHSKTDHVVGPASLSLLTRTLPASQLEVRELPDSYHVATLDNDAEAIFAGSLDFVRVHTQGGRASTGEANSESMGGD